MAKRLTKAQLRAIHAKKGHTGTDDWGTINHISGGAPNIILHPEDTLTDRELTPEEIDKIRTMIEWSGCMAFPEQCIIIKVVNRAYGHYRTKNNDTFQESVDDVASIIIHPLLKNQINRYSGPIFRIIDDLELTDNNSNEIEFDEAIFKKLIRGTISNVLNIM